MNVKRLTLNGFGDQRVAMRAMTGSGNGEVVYLSGDHLGSVSLATDGNGNLVSQARYAPYGQVRWSGDTVMPTKFSFTGQRAGSFGLMDYHARFYSPYLNRWIQSDDIITDPSNPQAYDRYSYVMSNPIKYTDPSGYHYCDSKYAAEDVCDWYNKAPLPDDVCRTDIFCYQAYLTYNEIIFQLGRIPTEEDILYMTAQTEGYSNKDREYRGKGTYEDNFVEGLARNYYQPYKACNIGSPTCTESKLYKFMSGYQVWYDRNVTPTRRASHLINDGLKNDAYRKNLEFYIKQITNYSFAERNGWIYGYEGNQPWQWHNWTRPPDLEKGEALGWIYLPTPYGNYFWIMTADQTEYFQNEIKPQEIP